ncbi:MAG: Lrp/AsnC family transcriptional regulator [Candidatus Freyarchaeota archaeon]|nr:Lrp/AsnC family transcriptional regulator [Candidatus Jordarchaeia archaeon]MBS7280333.1 Lrp/AsnC family transcriptional regulator [Candidatus Jordarchaeia archaeon]
MVLDELDKKIVELLSADSRLSYREIAKKLGVSHINVSSRIKKLEDEKIIRGYTVILDPEYLNLYSLCIRISAKTGANLAAIGREIASLPRVYVVLRVSGDCDLLVLGMCKDRQEALDLISKISNIKGIEKVESHVVLETIKLSGVKLKN